MNRQRAHFLSGSCGTTNRANPFSRKQSHVGEWYYIGHYGQLGPLTREQMDELISDGVVARDTYVWRNGQPDWLRADSMPDLQSAFKAQQPYNTPPPPPSVLPAAGSAVSTAPLPVYAPHPEPTHPHHLAISPLRSDRSKTAAGVLQLLIPGVGRMYMGFAAIGVLQLVLSLCGVGWVWSMIDGIVILSGGVKMDGYGRQLID